MISAMTSLSNFKKSVALTLIDTGKRIAKSISSTIVALTTVLVVFATQGDLGTSELVTLVSALGASIAVDIGIAIKSISADAEKLADEKAEELKRQTEGI